jgi:ferredoxin
LSNGNKYDAGRGYGTVKNKWKIIRKARIAAAFLTAAVMSAAFSGLAAWTARIPHAELAPALLRSIAAFSTGALATVLILIVLTWLFGRFYCACLCPLGIWQDLWGFLSRRAGRREKNLSAVRYLVGGIVFGALAGGWALGFALLDPYSNFGRGVAGRAALGGLIPLAATALLSVWKKRIFCTAVCPAGTLLGVFGRFGVFKVRFTEKCVKCGLCVKSCPVGCIDLASGTIDNERCVRCMNCLGVCKVSGVAFTARRVKAASAEAETPDRSRREFLIRGGVLLAGLAAGFAAARSGVVRAAARALAGAKKFVLPPGAGDPERFMSRCTACQLCTANCPGKVIVPAPKGGDGPVRLDLSRGVCLYDCSKCGNICPTGAIRPLPLEEKRHTKIAEAKFDPKLCLVCRTRNGCGRCAAVCPTGALKLKGSPGVPKLDARLCIGCGACRAACPATPEKALTVNPVARQTRIPDAVPELPVPAPGILPPGAGDAGRFLENCAGCGLCVANCSGGVIKPVPGGDGTVHLDLSRGACQYYCSKCGNICPTGAIRPLALEIKQHTKIAEAKFDPKLCLACHTEDPCGKCADACPAGAIRPVGPRRVPRLNKALCIGCGACQAACPARPEKAMTVHGVEKQYSTSG